MSEEPQKRFGSSSMYTWPAGLRLSSRKNLNLQQRPRPSNCVNPIAYKEVSVKQEFDLMKNSLRKPGDQEETEEQAPSLKHYPQLNELQKLHTNIKREIEPIRHYVDKIVECLGKIEDETYRIEVAEMKEKRMKKCIPLNHRYSVIVLRDEERFYTVELYHDLPMSLKKYLSGLPNAVFFRQGLDFTIATKIKGQILRNKSVLGLTNRIGFNRVQLKDGITEQEFLNSLQSLDMMV